jgi:hypothetical protein
MGILLGLLPFCVFFALVQVTTPAASLWGAAAAASTLVIREKRSGRSTKILEAGTLVLFSLLGVCTSFTRARWDVPTVRTVIDSGLLSIIVFSLAIRRPFTLQYAREQVSAEVWRSSVFVRTNYVISSAWAVAMAIVVISDLAMHFVSSLPLSVKIAAIVIALGGAIWFTKWYPEKVRVRNYLSVDSHGG